MNLSEYIAEYVSSGRRNKERTIVATDETIRQIVKDELDRLGHNADLNHIDVSEVTDMNSLFSCGEFDFLGKNYRDLNPDISYWDVRKVENMKWMFYRCKNFNKDISQWDVRKVEDMSCMFYNCESFNQDISTWDVKNAVDMGSMFCGCKKFNQDISKWNVSNVENTAYMFEDCPIKEKYKPEFK